MTAAVRNDQSSERHYSLVSFVQNLLLAPGARVNIEHGKKRQRLRFAVVDRETGKMVRRALELPNDNILLSTLGGMLSEYRAARKSHQCASNIKWRKDLKKRIIALSSCGRVVRTRIGLVFEIAADLGYATLVDFLNHEPWLASPFLAGRRLGQK